MGLSLARALRLEAHQTAKGTHSRAGGSAAGMSIAFVGAGGKTTAIFQLARQLKPPVIITTTTHLGSWQTPLADRHLIANHPADLERLEPSGVTLITGDLSAGDRLNAVSPDVLLWLHDKSRARGWTLLIEADGARQKALKAPDEHEPAIPAFVDVVAVVAGLSGLGRALSEDIVHRAGRFGEIAGVVPGEAVTPEALVHVLTHPAGGLKGIPGTARRVVLLNQADSPDSQARAHGMAPGLLGAFSAVIVASLEASAVHAVHENVAGILLAAGASERLGRPKQTLDWRGQPFVRAVAATALEAGLKPVIAVTGSGSAEVESALAGVPVMIVRNDNWRTGQASSIHAGVQDLPPSTGAAVFLLADQPQVRFDVIAALLDAHAGGLYPIVAPLVMMERRANPVLFDRDTFPDLLALRGDVGGRAVFSKHAVEYMPWHDDRLLLDVDTEDDYRRLMEDDTL